MNLGRAKPRLALDSMHGLGDNFYQRAIVKRLVLEREVYLNTPWPELYADLPVKLIKPMSMFRTQTKNAVRFKQWVDRPAGLNFRSWHYQELPGSMLEALEISASVTRSATLDFTGPPVRPVVRELKYMIVRPLTERKEWAVTNRNPYPEYIDRAARRAYAEGYEIISVADLEDGHEWLIADAPFANIRFHRGELTSSQLLQLVAGASGIISAVGWALPAAVAYKVPMLCVYGGRGGHNNPARLLDRRIDTRRIVQALPIEFCMCKSVSHNCNRVIDLEPYLEQYIRLAARAEFPVVA